MGPESRPRRRESVLSQSSGDMVVLLTLDTGEYYKLNEVGGRIWELADGTRSASTIARLLSEEYEAPVEQIEVDTLELLAELAAKSFVSDAAASD